jgi:hypothetical protein
VLLVAKDARSPQPSAKDWRFKLTDKGKFLYGIHDEQSLSVSFGFAGNKTRSSTEECLCQLTSDPLPHKLDQIAALRHTIAVRRILLFALAIWRFNEPAQ